MNSEKCPLCKTELVCLAGCSAHWSNWYCSNKACGYEAWNEKTHTKQPSEITEVSAMSCPHCDGITPHGVLLHSPGCPNESEGKQS